MPNDKKGLPPLEDIENKQNQPTPLPGILGRGEDYINSKVIQPFRQGLDTIGSGLQADSRKPGLTPLASGLEYGLGSLTKAAPVGNNLRETAAAMIVPPELGEEAGLGIMGKGTKDAVDIMSEHAAQVPPETWIKKAGATYKGSMPHPNGGSLHFFNDPKTDSTLAMTDKEIRSHHDVLDKINESRAKFDKGK